MQGTLQKGLPQHEQLAHPSLGILENRGWELLLGFGSSPSTSVTICFRPHQLSGFPLQRLHYPEPGQSRTREPGCWEFPELKAEALVLELSYCDADAQLLSSPVRPSRIRITIWVDLSSIDGDGFGSSGL